MENLSPRRSKKGVRKRMRKVTLWSEKHKTSSVCFVNDLIDPFFNINTPDDIKMFKEYFFKKMKIIGVVGWKDTGKTTLIEKLIGEFNQRNLTVSTIKHSHHNVSLDRQGTDSFRHFNAGAKETIFSRLIQNGSNFLNRFLSAKLVWIILLNRSFRLI